MGKAPFKYIPKHELNHQPPPFRYKVDAQNNGSLLSWSLVENMLFSLRRKSSVSTFVNDADSPL